MEFYSLGALLAKIWGLEFSLFKNLVKKFQIKLKRFKKFKYLFDFTDFNFSYQKNYVKLLGVFILGNLCHGFLNSVCYKR